MGGFRKKLASPYAWTKASNTELGIQFIGEPGVLMVPILLILTLTFSFNRLGIGDKGRSEEFSTLGETYLAPLNFGPNFGAQKGF